MALEERSRRQELLEMLAGKGCERICLLVMDVDAGCDDLGRGYGTRNASRLYILM